jgi:hypothetical protein
MTQDVDSVRSNVFLGFFKLAPSAGVLMVMLSLRLSVVPCRSGVPWRWRSSWVAGSYPSPAVHAGDGRSSCTCCRAATAAKGLRGAQCLQRRRRSMLLRRRLRRPVPPLLREPQPWQPPRRRLRYGWRLWPTRPKQWQRGPCLLLRRLLRRQGPWLRAPRLELMRCLSCALSLPTPAARTSAVSAATGCEVPMPSTCLSPTCTSPGKGRGSLTSWTWHGSWG